MNNNNQTGKRILFCVLVCTLSLLFGVSIFSASVYSLSDYENGLNGLFVGPVDGSLYLEINESVLPSSTDFSSYSLEVSNFENNNTYKYFGELVFPIKIPDERGQYLFKLLDSKSRLVSQIYLEYDSVTSFRSYASRKSTTQNPTGINNYSNDYIYNSIMWI